ncbi:SDR family NAD(P)-dependent oxidoreductase [Paenibacillus sp. FSL H8-0034]|uniref:SDR family NAD(P)-dependent oxidoreductase n=1 Tax=Paenibacillus sp. FSL H8-0034 TaxID=2954671 RepID=UPI004046A4DD
MVPRPIFDNPDYRGTGKLRDKVAIITGGDNGIGRAVAVAFAKEGADLAIVYLDEHQDAVETREAVNRLGRKCLLIPIDLRNKESSSCIVKATLEAFGHIEILVNKAGVQFVRQSLLEISDEQLQTTFVINILSFFSVSTNDYGSSICSSTVLN